MHDTIVNTIFSNTNNICILLGLLIRYSSNVISFFKKRSADAANEELVKKAQKHMIDVYHKDNADEDELTQQIVKNALMKEKIKELKKQITAKDITIDELKKLIQELEALLKHD